MIDEDDRDWSAVFERGFAEPESRVQARIFAEVFGDEYPAELSPFSYTSRTELRRIAAETRVAVGDTLVDVGSGRGGPGLWIAATTGADYVAVDIADTALAAVRARAEQLGLRDRTRTMRGAFDDIPLGEATVGAVMSIDALLFAPDKSAAAREVARVLRPGGRFVATTWDYAQQPVGRPPQVDDHRPLIEAAGLRVVAYEETPDWEYRERETTRRLIDAVDELSAESGEDPATVRAGLEEMAATMDAMSRRVLIVAERPAGD